MTHTDFKPFLWALTERETPSPVFAVGLTGVPFWLKTPLPGIGLVDGRDAEFAVVRTAIEQAHTRRWGSPFGRHTGYVYIRTPEEFHEFSSDGSYIGQFERRIPHMTSIVRADIEEN